METKTEKLYNIELTEREIISISEAIGETVEEAAMTGNDIFTFMEMAKHYLKVNPAKSDEVLNVIRNYTTINNLLLSKRHDLLSVIVKTEAIAKII